METYRIKLRLHSGLITPFQADTIFGGLCWAMRYNEGADALKAMLDDFCFGSPWFVISNAFPGDLLPKPMIKIKNDAPKTRTEQLELAKEAKRLKKINYLTPQEFLDLVTGKSATLKDKKEQPIIEITSLHNQVNRLTGTTVEGGQLFEEVVSYVNKHYDYLSVYVKIKDPGRLQWLESLFRLLGQTGLGKRKSTGKGSFSIIGIERCNLFEVIDKPNAFLSLSNFVPAPGDPTEGNYRVLIKYGKMGEEFALSEYPFKYPLLMLQAGSVFHVRETVQAFYGCMVQGIAPAQPEVLQYGLAFSVPAHLEAAEN